MRTVQSRILYFLVGTAFIFTFQGCDQVNKLVEYFSPKKTAAKPPAPVSVKPVDPAPAPAPTASAPTPAAPAADQSPLPPNVLAKVGNWTITLDEFKEQEKAAQELAKQNQLTYDLPSERLLGMIVEQQLLFQEAQRVGLDKDSKIAKQIEEARKLILSQTQQSKIVEGIQVSDEEVQKFYDENKQFYFEPVEYKIGQIVVGTEAEANDVFSQLAQGANFDDLVASVSKVKTKSDFMTEDALPFPKLKDVLKALDQGKFSSPFAGPEGFYIVKLEDKRGGAERPLDDTLKEGIKADLSYLKYLQGLQSLQEKIPVQTNIELIRSLQTK